MTGVRPQFGPHLRSRHVELAPVVRDEYAFLYDLAVAEGVGGRWRLRGLVPSPEEFVQTVNLGVKTQFIVRHRADAARLGHVVLYGYDERGCYGYLAGAMLPKIWRTGLPVEAMFLFAVHCFSVFPLRKAYFEVPEFNLGDIESALDRILVQEGKLSDHVYADGRYWDMWILALSRDRLRDAVVRYGRYLAVGSAWIDETPPRVASL